MKKCLFCSKEFIPIRKQYYCNECRLSGDARKAILKRYNHSEKNRIVQRKWYYKDIIRTKISKNKYNRSQKGKLSKLKWYEKNKQQVIEKQLTTYRKETISRTHAHDLMKRHFPNKVCTKCNATKNIHVHHKDINPFNNKLNNLLYLCSSCHGKEHERVRNLAIVPTSL